jgi:polar amino acid transport system substrate-binding protein
MFASAASRYRIAAVLSVLLALCAAPGATQTLPVRVLINDAPPYRIVETVNGVTVHSGIYIDILRRVAAETGLQLEFTELPFARAFRVMEAGGADIMLGPNRNPDREVYLRYLEPPLPREPKVFLQYHFGAPILGYEDLYGRGIAVLRGATYFDRFDADRAIERIAVDDYTAALRLVYFGRVDAVVIPELQARWLMQETGLRLRIAPYREAGRDSYIVLARSSPLIEHVDRIETALRRVMNGPALQQILQRYE